MKRKKEAEKIVCLVFFVPRTFSVSLHTDKGRRFNYSTIQIQCESKSNTIRNIYYYFDLFVHIIWKNIKILFVRFIDKTIIYCDAKINKKTQNSIKTLFILSRRLTNVESMHFTSNLLSYRKLRKLINS